MKRQRRGSAARAGAIGVVAALLVACQTSHGPEQVGTYIDDGSITAKVKSRFVEEGDFTTSGIDIATRDGVVTLSGRAATTLTKENAESIALKVPGVKLVRNEVVVRP